MKAIPIKRNEADAYVNQHHRHHKPTCADMFRVGCEEDGELAGVIQVGRPLSRNLDDGETVEVLRCCTNGKPNVASFLYSRAARIAKEMGYKKIITYILAEESGTSLKASGWHCEAHECGGGKWHCPSRPREITQLTIFGEEKKYPTEKNKGGQRRYKGSETMKNFLIENTDLVQWICIIVLFICKRDKN